MWICAVKELVTGDNGGYSRSAITLASPILIIIGAFVGLLRKVDNRCGRKSGKYIKHDAKPSLATMEFNNDKVTAMLEQQINIKLEPNISDQGIYPFGMATWLAINKIARGS